MTAKRKYYQKTVNSNNIVSYLYIKAKLEANYTWVDIAKELKKELKQITTMSKDRREKAYQNLYRIYYLNFRQIKENEFIEFDKTVPRLFD